MGKDISNIKFTREDFQAFAARLKSETELLKRWRDEGRLASDPPRIGLELEIWLVDEAGRPAPCNTAVLAQAQEPLLTLELRSEEHTSELQSRENLVCRLLLEKKKM